MKNTDIERKLIGFKQKIDEAKTEATEAEGAIKQLMQELQQNFSCKTVEEARQKREKLEQDLEVISGKLKKGIAKLEESYEW